MLHQILSSKRKNTIPRDNSFEHQYKICPWFYSGNWKFYDNKGKLIIGKLSEWQASWNNLEIKL
jgi:hypothetical protein